MNWKDHDAYHGGLERLLRDLKTKADIMGYSHPTAGFEHRSPRPDGADRTERLKAHLKTPQHDQLP